MNSTISDIITTVKSSYTIPNLLSTLTNIRPPRPGTAISTPSFIRSGDTHPSFGIYNHIAIDFATGKSYDVISLVQAALGLDFLPALEYLHGEKIFTGKSRDNYLASRRASHSQLDTKIKSWHEALLANPQILEYLHSRRISDMFISRYHLGYDSETQRLIIPLSKNDFWVYYTARSMNGQDPKYKKAWLGESEIYENVPWGLKTLLPGHRHYTEYEGVDGNKYQSDTQDPRDSVLVVTEGCFDGFSFAQEGWQVLATCGGHINKSFMPQFLNTAKAYREVFLCFDSDKAGNNFQRKMCRILFNEHIPFKCGHLPAEYNGQTVKDVSDYYVAGGDLAELVKRATPGLVDMAKNVQSLDELADLFHSAAQWVSPVKMFELKEACYGIEDEKVDETTGFHYAKYSRKIINFIFAQAMKPLPECDVAHMVDEKHKLLFDPAGVFYEYSRGIWEQISDYVVAGYAGEALGQKASSGRMKSVCSYLKSMHAMEDRDMIKMINRNPVIVLMNGTLHLDEKDPAKAFTPHSEMDMSTQHVTFNYDPTAKAEKWLKYVHDVNGGNPAKMRLMQQMAGYVMCPDNRMQKFFYLLGDGSNGKSVFMNILEAVYGPDNCSSVQPSRLGTQFDPIALKDSMLNLCYEAKVALNGSEEALKALSSGDAIMAAHKGVDAVKFSTRAKFFIAANKCFASDDVSFGFLRRIIFFKFDEQFVGSGANKNLTKELLEELPGIFNWCYAGYLDLMQSGEFEELADNAEIVNDLMTQMSPTHLFVREVFPKFTGISMTDHTLYTHYKEWCDAGGFKRLNRIEFMKDVMLLIRQGRINVEVTNDEGERYFLFTGSPQVSSNSAEQSPTGGRTQAGSVIALSERVAEGSSNTAQGQAEGTQTEDNVSETSAAQRGPTSEAVHSGTGSGVVPASGQGSGRDILATRRHDSDNQDAVHEVQAPRTQESKITEAESLSGSTYTYSTPEELHAHYKACANEQWLSSLTLGDWRMLYAYYQRNPNMRPQDVDFYGECRQYVNKLKASLRKKGAIYETVNLR